MAELDSDMSAAVGELEDSSEGEGEEEVEETSEEQAAAVAALPTDNGRPRSRRGKHRRKVLADSAAGIPPRPTAQDTTAVNHAHTIRDKNVALIWDNVLLDLAEQGRGPAEVAIHVKRYILSGQRTAATAVANLRSIEGMLVCGTEQTSAGESLIEYVTDVYHLAAPVGSARYVFTFFYKKGASNRIPSPEGELILGEPREIIQQREAAQMFARRRANEGPPPMHAYAPPPMMPAAPVWRQPPPGYESHHAPPAAPPAVAPAPVAPVAAVPAYPGASLEIEAMRRDLETRNAETARLEGMYQERARLEGLRPAGPVESPEQAEARLVRVVITAMAAAGIGAVPQAHAAPVQPPVVLPPTPAQVAAATNPMHQIEQVLNYFEQSKKLEKRAAAVFAPLIPEPDDDEPEPPRQQHNAIVEPDPWAMKEVPLVGNMTGFGKLQFGPRLEGEGLTDYVLRLAAHNPTAAEAIISRFGAALTQSAVGQAILKKLLESGAGAAMSAMSGGAVVDMPQPQAQPQSRPTAVPPMPPPPPKWTPSG